VFSETLAGGPKKKEKHIGHESSSSPQPLLANGKMSMIENAVRRGSSTENALQDLKSNAQSKKWENSSTNSF
jgi:hypothetical protein